MSRRQTLDAYRVYLILNASMAFFLALIWTLNIVYQVETVRLNPFQIVLVGTALELTAFLFEVPTGIVADAYSRRLSVILGVFFLGTGFILMGAVPVFWVLLLSQVICGIGYTFMSGAEQAWISDEIGEENAGRAFVRGSQAATIGGLAGIPVAVALGSIELYLPVVVGGALIMLLGAALMLVMPEHGFTPESREDHTRWQSMSSTLREGTRLVRRRPVLLTILGIAAVFGMYNEGFDRLWRPHLIENFTFPTIGGLDAVVWFGAISAVTQILGLVALEVVRRRIDMNSHLAVTRMLLGINAALVGCMVAFGLAGSFAMAIGVLVVATVLREIIYPIKTAWVNQSLDSRVRATVISMNGQADAIGQIAGGPMIGAVGTIFSLRAAIVAAGVALAPGLLLYLRALGLRAEAPVASEETVAAAEL